jgi:hypothetical protein
MYELNLPASQADLEGAPVPAHVLLPKGMLEVSEQKLLYLLARDYYDGAGEIIDAGAFCGASSYALAAGVADNQRVSKKDGRVHSYDLFQIEEPYTLEYIQNVFYSRYTSKGEKRYPLLDVHKGDSFLDVFLFQTQRYSDIIRFHAGSLLEVRWSKLPISLLFIDCAKTLEVQKHIVKQFMSSQISGNSILVQQDFYHPWHPYIHVLMEYLEEYFEIIVPSAGSTRAYKLVKSIPRRIIQRASTFDFADEEIVALLKQMITKCPERPMLNLVLARQLHLLNRHDQAAELLESLLAQFRGTRTEGQILEQFKAVCPSVADRFSQAVAAE